ncbi:uncharacterized protein MELLADRAFT_123709 [Melampsora larici-populina 98AG31]|uniref:Secreted protein n=1 Tax=Melampsora larici-populina (strain 98AG31 / pathotype 3-4-7) TaxID=747676 RepID=F4R7N9_MELLP|nr:uncharacterized protein MELLADRAFT_123709 [Melampsora larici-populina 98AG31]EGG11754.1 secreted protein [Melampsora larici-populina 98AG31]
MRSFSIVMFTVIVLVQSLFAAPAALSVRSEQTVAVTNDMKVVEAKIWGYGFPPSVVSQYAYNNGYTNWGTGCGTAWGCGCTPANYRPSCFATGCGYAGGYYSALNGLNTSFQRLYYLRQAELKSQVNQKDDDKQA